jgi:hypothetical protein
MNKWSFCFGLLFITLLLGCQDEEKVRVGFITDIHFDVPSRSQPFGGIELDGDTSDFEIPVASKIFSNPEKLLLNYVFLGDNPVQIQ